MLKLHQLLKYKSVFKIASKGRVLLVISAMLGGATPILAAPSGGVVTIGHARIFQRGKTTTIDQSTNKASINWQSFSIARNETVNFVQPSVSSITLNRVVGATKSLIKGTMNAKGQVFLINPNGIIFSKSSSVNVGGIVASTLNLSNKDFQNGDYHFSGTSTASVLNMGTITAKDGGYVAMIGKSVVNEGIIQAKLGNVQLVGASDVTLNLNGNSLLSLTINKGIFDALVKNGGVIKASGGQVYLTIKALNTVLNGLVNNTGIIQAKGIENKNGHIVLFANGGTLQAGGILTTGKGSGHIETSGDVFKSNASLHVTTGNWLLDPYSITIGFALANSIDNALENGDVIISTNGSNTPSTSSGQSSSTTANRDITVNAPMDWSTNTLVLSAGDSININKQLDLTNTAGLFLQYAQASGSSSTYNVNAPINITTTGSFSTQQGTNAIINYTIIDSLGKIGSKTGRDLQGINGNLSGNYALGTNIDASVTSSWNSNKGFDPIGNSITNFSGTFDGLGHTINKLAINRPSTDNIGLFGYTALGSVIKNIGVTNEKIIGDHNVGGLVGYNYSVINNSYATGSVTGGNGTYNSIGGLVGHNFTVINNSYFTGNVTGGNGYWNNVGGLIGKNDGKVNTSYATGRVAGGSGGNDGGLIGRNNGTVNTSYATGNVAGKNGNYNYNWIGGLVGYNTGLINNSYATGSVTGKSDYTTLA